MLGGREGTREDPVIAEEPNQSELAEADCRAGTHLLRMLGDHEYEGEIVHSQSEIEKLVRVAEENDVLDRIFCSFRIFACARLVSSVCLVTDSERQEAYP